jgi:hypothetical protein
VSAALVACGGGGSGSRNNDADGDSVADAQDCAPNNPAASGLLAFESEDADSDGHFVNADGEVCAGAALPPQYAAGPIAGDADCDDDDDTAWQLLPYSGRDADVDGHSVASAGEICAGASLPADYLAAAPVPPEDCDDADSSAWRFMTIYADADGDAVGAGPGNVTCIGVNAVPGFSLLGYDPLDDPQDSASAGISTLDLSSWQLTAPED